MRKILPFSLFLAVFVACSHQRWLEPPDIRQVPLQNLKNRRVAVVLDPNIQNRYAISYDGHDFSLEEMRSYFKQTFLRTFKGLAKEIHFGSEPGYDVYVRPELTLSMSGTLSKSCFAHLSLTIVDGSGKRLAYSKASGEGTFTSMDYGTDACAIALPQAITAVWTTALPAMDTALATP